MPVVASDLRFFQSEMEGSSGGTISPIEVPQGFIERFFTDTPLDAIENGGVLYRKVFLVNTNLASDLLLCKLWALLTPTSGERVAFAIGTSNDTDPLPLQFQEHNDESTALLLGTVGNTPVPIWIRRLTPPGLPAFQDRAMFQLAFKGESE